MRDCPFKRPKDHVIVPLIKRPKDQANALMLLTLCVINKILAQPNSYVLVMNTVIPLFGTFNCS